MTTPNKLTRTRPRRRADSSLLMPWPDVKLCFSPTAWAKLVFLRDIGETEVVPLASRRATTHCWWPTCVSCARPAPPSRALRRRGRGRILR